MRLRCVLALVVLLTGCVDADRSGIVAFAPATPNSSLISISTESAADVSSKTDQYCRNVADTRASDAGAQGFDSSIQQSVYREAYADCVHWSSNRLVP